MEETVIFNVDTSEYEAALARINKDITTLRENQKLYQQQTKDGVAGAAEAYERVSAELKIQQQAYRTTQAVLVGYNATQKQAIDLVKLENNSIQQNRDLLKQLTAQIINTRNPSEKFKQQVKDVSDALKKQEAALGDNRRNVGNYAEGFKSAFSSIVSGIPALSGFQKAQEGVNLALAANPVGAVITGFTALLEIFKSNATVADTLSFAVAGLTKGFGFIVDTIVNTVSSLDNLTAALSHPIDFIVNLAKGTANAAKEGYNAAAALDEFELSAGRFDRAIQLNQVSVESLTKSLKDRTKTEQERIKIANQIADTEIKNADLLVKKNKELLAAESLRLKDKTLNAAEQNKLEQIQTDVLLAELEKRTIESQRQTRINILLEKEAAKEKVQIRSDELRSIDDLLKKQAEDEAKFFAEQTERELDALVRQEQITARRVGSVEAAVNAELVARNRALQKEKLTATERENILRESEDRISEIRRRAAEEAQRISDEELKNYKRNQQAVVDSVSQISNAIVNILGLASQLINQLADQNVQALNEQYEQGTLKQAEFEQQTKEIKLKAWKQSKDIALTQAVMNTANAVMAQLSNPTPYVGIVLAALAAATGAIQIGLIASQKPPKFAKGGKVIDIDGKSHSQGGTPIHVNGQYVAEAEKDEGLFIMKKNAYSELKKLSDWNQSFGGNSWGVKTTFAAMGGSISDGGFTTREIITQVNDTNSLKTAVIEGVRSMPNPVVSVQEINRVNTVRNKSVAVSELG